MSAWDWAKDNWRGVTDYATLPGWIGLGLNKTLGTPKFSDEAGGVLGINPKSGSDTAAGGMAAGAAEARQLSQLEWQRQMQGLDRAHAALNPYRSLYDSIYGTQTAGPPPVRTLQESLANAAQARAAAPPARYGALLAKLNGGGP